MDENVKHRFRQYTSPKKYARKKGKAPYKSENVPDMQKNDKKNDTKVFVLTPDMLKKLGLNLNAEQSIEKTGMYLTLQILLKISHFGKKIMCKNPYHYLFSPQNLLSGLILIKKLM